MKSIATLLLSLIAWVTAATAQTALPETGPESAPPTSASVGPDIDVQAAFVYGVILCDSVRVDSIRVRNSGDAPLTVTPTITGANLSLFTLVRPASGVQISIPAKGEVWMVIEFRPGSIGPKSAVLTLATNAPSGTRQVPLSGELKEYTASLEGTEIDFGQICVGDRVQKSLKIFYEGGIDNRIARPVISNDPTRVFVAIKPDETDESAVVKSPFDTSEVIIEFRPNSVGTYSAKVEVPVGQCNLLLPLTVKGSAVFIRDSLESAKEIDFNQVAVGGSRNSQLRIRNYGSSPSTLKEIYVEPPSLATEYQLPVALIGNVVPSTDIIRPTITFKPTKFGRDSGMICFVMGAGNCLDTMCVKVKGEGVAPVLMLSRQSLNFTVDSCSEPAIVIYDTVYLYNRGTYPSLIKTAGSNNPKVQVTTFPQLNYLLQPGDSLRLVVAVSPGQPGPPTGQIIITTDDPDPTRQQMFLDIFMKLESTVIKLLLGDGSSAPAGIDFGRVFGCGPKRDTFNLRNAGTLDAIVNGGLSSGTAFTITPAPPYDLKGNATTQVVIEFNPATPGEFRDTLTVQNGTCGDQVIRLAMAGRRYELLNETEGIDFGASNLGQERVGVSSIANTSFTPSDIRLRVSEVYITPPGGPFTIIEPLPADLPAELAPNEALTVDVLFKPTAASQYDAQICYVTDSPCPDTVCVPLSGSGVTADLLVRQSTLHFGTRYICQGDTTLTLSILNLGSDDLDVEELNIVPGPGAGAFTQITPVDLPRTIAGRDSILVAYSFSPDAAPSDGQVSATLEVVSNDPRLPKVDVRLVARRRSISLTAPSNVNFGAILVNLTQTGSAVIVNNSPDTVRIERYDLAPPFSVSGTPPTEILPFDSIVVDLEFSPKDTLVYNDTLRILYGDLCLDTLSIALLGQGRPPVTGFAEITIPTTLTGEPGKRIEIPIVLVQSQRMEEVGATTFRARLRFNGTLLDPLGVRVKGESFPKGSAESTGRIIDTVMNGSEMVMNVEFMNSPFPTGADTLGFIDALVMLGDAITTPIEIDTVVWTDANVRTTENDGTFALQGYCDAGGNRLLKVSGSFGIKTVAPNPFNPTTEILFETAEAGETTLTIHDLYGRQVAVLIDGERLPVQAHVATWDASAYPSGIYHAVLVTPTQRSVYRLFLMK